MDQKRYRDLKDMIDGGGAGQMGDTFQGGGLLSILANAFAKPYGSEDPVRKRERMKVFGLLGDDMPKPVQVQPVMRTNRQAVPTYGADAGLAATNRAMNMPYNQTQAMPGYNMPARDPRGFAPNTQPTFSSGTMPSSVGRSGAAMNMPYNRTQGMPGYNMPQLDPFQQAAKSLADELGNAFYTMPMQEQLMRIQQRVDAMRGM